MNEQAQRACRQGRMLWVRLGLTLAVAVLLATAMTFASSKLTPSASAVPADVGVKDYKYTDGDSDDVDRTTASGNEVAGPTSEKPQSKLWYNDGSWWGVLFNPDAPGDGRYEIYRHDETADAWVSTNVAVDDRNDSRADALWDQRSGKLYIASAGPNSQNAEDDGRLTRYSYDATVNTYTEDPNFPVAITEGGMEAIVLERDTTGQFWVTYTRNGKVRINTSKDATGTEWNTPFILDAPGAENLTTDDISSIVSFDSKIGVMWSNQTDGTLRFATHRDANDDDTAFQADEPPINLPSGSDDHINLKSLQADPSGRIFAVVKTGATSTSDKTTPLNVLVVRNADGTFKETTFGTVADNHTRPVVLIDGTNDDLYVFATAPTAGGSNDGGTIYYKKTGLADPSFANKPGRGTPFIRNAEDPDINDPTSTKQTLTGASDLLVLASDKGTDYYLHNHMDLAGAANTSPKVTAPAPAPGSKVKDRTPRIRATVSDAETELSKRDIDLFLDGRTIPASRFAYNAETDRLAYNSGKLSYGRHKVRVVATDAQGASGRKAWSFTVKRRR